MSDGMSDATASGGLAADVREAAHKLAEALRRAEKGHRGFGVNPVPIVNHVLSVHELPWRLVERR